MVSVGNFNLRMICNELSEVRYKCSKVGVQLGIPSYKLKEFEKADDDPLAAIVDYWLRGNVTDYPLTWKSVVEVLSSSHVDAKGLADRISAKYCPEAGTTIITVTFFNKSEEAHFSLFRY